MPARAYGGLVTVDDTSNSGETVILAAGNHAYNAGLMLTNSFGIGSLTMNANTNNPNVTISTFTFIPTDPETINAGSGSWTISSTTVLSSGTFNAQSSSITVGGDFTISTSAIFNAGTSTVAFNGSSQQNVTSSTRTYATLSILNTSAGGVRFLDSLTVSTFTALQAGTTVQFAVGTSSLTVTKYLGLGPTSGTKLGLRSATNGTQWTFVLSTGATQSVRNTDVKDSNANPGITILANDGTSVNSGNDLNWKFGPPGSPTLFAVYRTTITVNWSTAGLTNRNGFEVDASTASDFTGTLFSTITTNTAATTLTDGTVSPLAPNTTYFVRSPRIGPPLRQAPAPIPRKAICCKCRRIRPLSRSPVLRRQRM